MKGTESSKHLELQEPAINQAIHTSELDKYRKPLPN